MATSAISCLENNFPVHLLPGSDEPITQTLSSKAILNALSARVWPISQPTLNYRLRGEDTLTWGDQTRWFEVKGIGGLLSLPHERRPAPSYLPLEGHPDEEFVEFIETRARKYGALLNASSLIDHMRRLEEIYSLRHAEDVRGFLYTYPQLVEVLLEAHAYLKKYFGPDPQVTLEVVSDPEVEGWDELFAYILTSLPVDEALARQDELDEEWFLDQLDRVSGLLNFNLEFA